MHDAYTKMPFPPYPLSLATCTTSQLYFYRRRTRLEKTRVVQKMEKGVALKVLTGAVPVCLVCHGDFHRFIPSIKTNPPKVGYRLSNHVSPQTPTEKCLFRLHNHAQNLRSQVKEPRINCAPGQRLGTSYTVTGNCAWKCTAK